MPRISAILPVYNAERFLAQAIESLRDQTFTDFEILAFDDASTDSSWSILQNYATRDPRIIPTKGEHRGYTAWLGEGVARARGEFVARMDADDVSEPSRFQRQVDYLDRHPHVGCVGTQALRIDPNGLPIDGWTAPTDHVDIDASHFVNQSSSMIHPSVMIRTDVLRRVGGYRSEFEPAEDLDLWLRLAEVTQIANIDERLLRYRLHFKNVSSIRLEQQVIMAVKAVASAWERRGYSGVPPATRPVPTVPSEEQLRWTWARAAFRAKHFRTARTHALSLAKSRPGQFRHFALLGAAGALEAIDAAVKLFHR